MSKIFKWRKQRSISDTNFTIATVVPPVVEEKVVEAVAPEAAEGAEVKEKEGRGGKRIIECEDHRGTGKSWNPLSNGPGIILGFR